MHPRVRPDDQHQPATTSQKATWRRRVPAQLSPAKHVYLITTNRIVQAAHPPPTGANPHANGTRPYNPNGVVRALQLSAQRNDTRKGSQRIRNPTSKLANFQHFSVRSRRRWPVAGSRWPAVAGGRKPVAGGGRRCPAHELPPHEPKHACMLRAAWGRHMGLAPGGFTTSPL